MTRDRPSRRVARRLAVAATATVLLLSGACIKLPWAHPNIEPFHAFRQDSIASEELTVHFLGTSSLLFRGRDSISILMDGFVSRPGWFKVGLGRIGPDCEQINAARARLRIDSLAAVFVGHSHYDHAMDAPVWAQMTGAKLVGSLSTEMLGRGIGLPDDQDTVVREDVPLRFGDFELTFVESVHGPPDRYPGSVYEPLRPPRATRAWKTGLVYSVFIRHRGRTILVQSTAGYKPGALRGRHADVVYLAIGGLGHHPLAAIDAYWDEVVRATGARRVILVHWDDFFRPLSKPLEPTPYGGDDVPRGMGRIIELAEADGIQVWIPRAWQPADPFAGLNLPPAALDTAAAVRQPPIRHPQPDSPYCPAVPNPRQ